MSRRLWDTFTDEGIWARRLYGFEPFISFCCYLTVGAMCAATWLELSISNRMFLKCISGPFFFAEFRCFWQFERLFEDVSLASLNLLIIYSKTNFGNNYFCLVFVTRPKQTIVNEAVTEISKWGKKGGACMSRDPCNWNRKQRLHWCQMMARRGNINSRNTRRWRRMESFQPDWLYRGQCIYLVVQPMVHQPEWGRSWNSEYEARRRYVLVCWFDKHLETVALFSKKSWNILQPDAEFCCLSRLIQHCHTWKINVLFIVCREGILLMNRSSNFWHIHDPKLAHHVLHSCFVWISAYVTMAHLTWWIYVVNCDLWFQMLGFILINYILEQWKWSLFC